MASNRLFFALWPNDEVRHACAEAARLLNIRQPHGGHASAIDHYHLTLLWLGAEVPADSEAAILRAAAQVQAPPFALSLDQASGFGAGKNITWWLGERQRSSALTAFQKRLREWIYPVHRPQERWQFSPHLSIARSARSVLPPTLITPITWAVDEFVLIRSSGWPGPVRYQLLGHWPLDAAAAPVSPPQPQLDLGF